MHFKRHVRAFLLTTAIATSIVIAINRVIDPYGVFNRPQFKGVNVLKPEYDKHICLGKALAIETIKPRAIILGSSRANNGLDPNHDGFASDQPVFNAAIDGGNIYIASRFLQHANALQPLKRVILGADFFMFNIWFRNRADFDETYLKLDQEKTPLRRSYLSGISAALTSASALHSSLQTFLRQDALPNNIQPYGPLGRHEWEMMAAHIVIQGGYRRAFLANEEVFISRTFRPEPSRRYDFEDRGARSSLLYFKQIAEICRRNGIELIVAILPAHARQNEAIRASGLWPKFEDWKRQLVQILSNESQASGGNRPFALWDFSGYNSMTTETVPDIGNTESKMRYYFESSHFKKELGDMVLDRALGYQSAQRVIPADFGVLLTTGNVESHLAQIQSDQRNWRIKHPADVSEIENIARPLGIIPSEH
jgi:hypothetical protein